MIIDKKFLNPKAYIRKIGQLLAKLAFRLNLPLLVTTKVDDLTIHFVATSYTEFQLRARESFRREEVTMYWLREVVMPDDAIYDIGANVGAYSLYAGKKIKDGKGQVYAFEPAFSNFFPLCRNIEVNSLNETIIPYPLAFGDSRHESSFYLRSTTTGTALHGLSKAESEGRHFDAKFCQGVSVVSLDSFITNQGVRFPNHIKIDVDGSELAIIRGMMNVLGDERLKSLMIEINTDLNGNEIESIVTGLGMKEDRIEQWSGKNTFNKLFLR